VCFFPGKIRAPAHNSCVTPGFVHLSVRKHIPVDFTPSTGYQFLCFHTRARLGWVRLFTSIIPLSITGRNVTRRLDFSFASIACTCDCPVVLSRDLSMSRLQSAAEQRRAQARVERCEASVA
jgi:hypothetical protein